MTKHINSEQHLSRILSRLNVIEQRERQREQSEQREQRRPRRMSHKSASQKAL